MLARVRPLCVARSLAARPVGWTRGLSVSFVGVAPASSGARLSASLRPLTTTLKSPSSASIVRRWAAPRGVRALSDAPSGAGPFPPSPPLPEPPSRNPAKRLVQLWRENNAKLKALWTQYGWFAVGTYFGVYLVTLGSIWGLVHAGVIEGPDVNAWINGLEVKKRLLTREVHLSPAVTEFLTAWLLTKTTEPIRAIATIVLVPTLVRTLPTCLLAVFRMTRPAKR